MSARLNRRLLAELELLAAQRLLTPLEHERIAARYPVERWDLLVLIRWFTILGAITAAVGLAMLANAFVNAIRLGEGGLAVAAVGLIALARWLSTAKRLEKTAATLELMAGFALQGLTTLLAIDFASGSDDWPALVGWQSLLLAMLAYALRNRLVLIHAGVLFFIFFGGQTGYDSAWGAYWLEMDYPVRFVAAGLVFIGVAWLHATRLPAPWQPFARVYAHLGLIDIHLALWFLSVFGYFEDQITWTRNDGQRLLFSLLWAAVSVGCMALAGPLGQRLLRGYGLTFLIIDVYTFYFQFVVARSSELWMLHLLLAGGSLVVLGIWLERRLKT